MIILSCKEAWEVWLVCSGRRRSVFGGSAGDLSQFDPSQQYKQVSKKRVTTSWNLLVYRKANWNTFAYWTEKKKKNSSVYMNLWQGCEGKVYFYVLFRNKKCYRLFQKLSGYAYMHTYIHIYVCVDYTHICYVYTTYNI